MDTDSPPEAMPRGAFPSLDNMMVVNGKLKSRPGWVTVSQGAGLGTGKIIAAHASHAFDKADWFILHEYRASGAYHHAWHAWSPQRQVQTSPTLFAQNAILPMALSTVLLGASYSVPYRSVFANSADGEIIVCNGYKPILIRISSDGTMFGRFLGLDAPGAPPATADGGAGVLNGAYNYVASWYNSTENLESAPSPTLVTGDNDIAVVNKKVTVTKPTGTAPYGTTHWRIYRRRTGNTAAAKAIPLGNGTSITLTRGDEQGQLDATHYFIAEIALATGTYDDNYVPVFNGDVPAFPPPPALVAAPLTGPQYVAVGGTHAFYANYRSRTFYWSQQRDNRRLSRAYEYVNPLDVQEVPVDKDDFITGLKWYNGLLYVFTQYRVFAYDTSPIDTASGVAARPVTSGPIPGAAGCVSYWTIKDLPDSENKDGALIWAGIDGIYVSRGGSTSNVIKFGVGGIGKYWQTFYSKVKVGDPSWYGASAEVDPKNGLYYLTAPVKVGDVFGAYQLETVIFNLRTGSFGRSSTLRPTCYVRGVEIDTSGNEAIYFDNGDGNLKRLDDDRYSGNVDGTHLGMTVSRTASGTVYAATLRIEGNDIVLHSYDAGGATEEARFNRTAAAYDTMSELVAAIEALANWTATLNGPGADLSMNIALPLFGIHAYAGSNGAGPAEVHVKNSTMPTCQILTPRIDAGNTKIKKHIEDFYASFAAPVGTVAVYFGLNGVVPTTAAYSFVETRTLDAANNRSFVCHCGVDCDNIQALIVVTPTAGVPVELLEWGYDGVGASLR